ncbi:MAG: HAD hydrolase family protein, partial [Clostridiales bacterium]|nr:HAD hydrolase family protein [Clostridiales bacterium]
MIFASDLDNTLIHSYKVAEKDDICVEKEDGKELSFMPRESFCILKKIFERCIFVPVTTRSQEQYRRIDLGVRPKYAIVAHGALLLVDGIIDESWLSETRRQITSQLPKISQNGLIYDIRYVDEYFIFAKSKNPQAAVAHIEGFVNQHDFGLYAVFNKIYILPRWLNKGIAVTRLKKRLGAEKIISAGDSELDIPMLEIADIAVHPNII